jgi:hypothetical protein
VRRSIWATALAIAVIAAGGCAARDDGRTPTGPTPTTAAPSSAAPSPAVPSGEPTGEAVSPDPSATPAAEGFGAAQRATAEAFYTCLIDAGLPATFDDRRVYTGPEDIQADVWFDKKNHDVIVFMPGQGGSWAGKSGEFSAADDAFYAEHRNDDYVLLIDGVDHAATLESCHKESGYTVPGRATTDSEELTEKQEIIDATNPWIACARENGMPNLEYLTAVADEWATYPKAVIPLSTTAEELRALLEACPNFDEDMTERSMQPGFNWESDHVRSPTIWIDDAVDPTDPHYLELYEVLWEKDRDFWQTAAPAEGTAESEEE